MVKSALSVFAALVLASGCSSTPKSTGLSWPAAELVLAPSADYVHGLIDACRAEPTRQCRDATADAALAYLDDFYSKAKKGYLASGGGDRSKWWQSVPVLNLIFATASSRESQTSKVADMSAATALLNGITSIFRRPDDKATLLQDKGIVAAQMDEDRSAIATRIALGLTQDLAHYSLEDALADLGRYRDAGTPEVAKAKLANLLGI